MSLTTAGGGTAFGHKAGIQNQLIESLFYAYFIEGRDIGTVILPKADIKFYFTCSLDVAAKRRFKELRKKDNKIKLADVKKSLKIRNYRDKNRKNSPLIRSKDAVIVRTDKLKNITGMVSKMSEIVEKKIKNKYGS